MRAPLLPALAVLAVALPASLGEPPRLSASLLVAPATRSILASAVPSGSTPRAEPAVEAAAPARPDDPPAAGFEAAARAALRRQAARWGLLAAEIAAASLVTRHEPGAGPVVLAFRRRLGGVEVLGEQAAVVLDRAGAEVATLGSLGGGQPRPGAGFALHPEEAAAGALAVVAGAPVAPGRLARGPSAGPWISFTMPGASARVRRAWIPDGGALASAWAVEVALPVPGAAARAELLFLGGDDGLLRSRQSLVQAEAFSYRVWAGAEAPHLPFDGPTGLAGTPHPTGLPDGFQPPLVAQNLVTLASTPFSRADPWLPAGATETVGNNADVYADLDGSDGYSPPADERGALSGPGAFDWTADLALQPEAPANRQAALAHLFFVVNHLHDWFYDAGFDEAAGNAQADNLGRGGLGGDPLVVEAQDPALRNSANMTTYADGVSPRLQLGLYTGITARYVAWEVPAAPAGRPAFEEATSSAFGQAAPFDLTAPLVAVDDGVPPAGDGCDAGPWTTDVTGRIALVDATGCTQRSGLCTCAAKALRAQEHGAVGVLIAHDVPGQYLFLAFEPPDPTVTIPVLGLKQETGAAFRAAAAAGPLRVGMHRSAPALRRDGAVDTLLVAHEWAHHLSSRLVGGGGGLGTTQALAMGEGWSDFVALLLAVREEDSAAAAGAVFSGAYAASSWALGGEEALFGGPNQAWYFGTRRVPYSTDSTRNALTFRHLQAGEPLPVATPGGAPIPFLDNGLGNAELHNAGEVWATMLWECYAGLLRDTLGPAPRLGFAEAKGRMTRYLVASLKATPPNPTWLEARDALLAVARAGDPADEARCWQAFARRGAGQGAVGPDRYAEDNRPVLESYVSPYPEPGPPRPHGGCQAGEAGALSLLGLLALSARRTRPRRPAGRRPAAPRRRPARRCAGGGRRGARRGAPGGGGAAPPGRRRSIHAW